MEKERDKRGKEVEKEIYFSLLYPTPFHNDWRENNTKNANDKMKEVENWD